MKMMGENGKGKKRKRITYCAIGPAVVTKLMFLPTITKPNAKIAEPTVRLEKAITSNIPPTVVFARMCIIQVIPIIPHPHIDPSSPVVLGPYRVSMTFSEGMYIKVRVRLANLVLYSSQEKVNPFSLSASNSQFLPVSFKTFESF